MNAEWYDVPAGVTDWQVSVPSQTGSPDGSNFLVFAEDYVSMGEHEARLFQVQAGLARADDDVEWLTDEPVNPEQPWRAKIVYGEIQPADSALNVRIKKPLGKPLRVFIGIAAQLWPREECERCKALVKLGIRAARVMSGTLGPDDFVDMAENAGFNVPQRISDFLDKAFGEDGIWDRIKEISRRLSKAFRWLDRLARKICEELDFCPRTANAPP